MRPDDDREGDRRMPGNARFLGKARTAAIALGALGALAGGAALAAQAGMNSSDPVDITANEAEVQQENKLTIWRGEVEALQGQNRLRTPELTVYYSGAQEGQASGGGMGSIQRMEAKGPVYFVTPTQSAKGDHGTYTAADDTLTLTGQVILMQDKNVVRGEKLVIHQKTGQSTLYASAQGRGSSGRVRGVFYPNQNNAGQAAPATPAPTAR
jgi:lipopolysaccharide export system protein LptA